jgi:cytochrome c peroxidase
LSVGVSGNTTKRNSMSLANLLWVRQLFWDGRASSLEEQAMGPHPDEMAQSLAVSCQKLEKTKLYPALFLEVFHTKKITPELITKSIAQFERTLISANAKYDQYLAGIVSLNPQESNGLKLFQAYLNLKMAFVVLVVSSATVVPNPISNYSIIMDFRLMKEIWGALKLLKTPLIRLDLGYQP